MKELFSLGEIYPSDFLLPHEEPFTEKVEMKLVMDESIGAPRLEKVAPLGSMYGERYWYRSGINNTMKIALKDIVDSITGLMKLKENDVWIDVASNDGTLLSNVSNSVIRVGIDPAGESFAVESRKHANLIIQDFFSKEVFQQSIYGRLKAKIVTSIAMFYDLEKPAKFIQDVHAVLDDEGLWVLQLSYTPLMLEQMEFGNICHEHVYYYSLFNLKKLLESNGFKIMDCQLNDVNGGSFRVYAMKDSASGKSFGAQPHRDVCKMRVESLLAYEKTLKLDEVETWMNFYERIQELKEKTVSFIKQAKQDGKEVWIYGASTKLNTLLQYFGLDNSLITAAAERSPAKWGTRTISSNIPIVSEEEMRKANPAFLLLGPWFFFNEFMEREFEYLCKGGKFIIPAPQFEVKGYGE